MWRQPLESCAQSQSKGDSPISSRYIGTCTKLLIVSFFPQADYKPLRLAGTARRISRSEEILFAGTVFIGTASPVGPNLTSHTQIGVFYTKHFADMRFAMTCPWSVQWRSEKCKTLKKRFRTTSKHSLSIQSRSLTIFLINYIYAYRLSKVAKYPVNEVPGLSFYDLVHSMDLPHVAAGFRNCKY